MKFLHTADLHIGRKLGERNLFEDQKYILDQILTIIREKKVDGVLISGDIYDKNNPGCDAIDLVENFLNTLAENNIPIFIIYGNHDSAERLSYGNKIFARHKIYITDRFEGTVPQISMEDEYGTVTVYLLPNLKINAVREYYPDSRIETLHDAVFTVLSKIPLDKTSRSVILAHQFVAGSGVPPEISDSETISVGDLDEIDADIFAGFDYTALGHLHKSQKISRPEIRYSGSPLKYSKSEKDHHKSVTLVTLKEKGSVEIEEIPLTPLHEVREVCGLLDEITSRDAVSAANADDYIYVTLTDSVGDENTIAKVKAAYPNYVKIERLIYEKETKETSRSIEDIEKIEPMTIFAEFYERQYGKPLTDLQKDILNHVYSNLKQEEL